MCVTILVISQYNYHDNIYLNIHKNLHARGRYQRQGQIIRYLLQDGYEFVSVWDCGDVLSEDLHHYLITGFYINGLEHYNDVIMGAIASQITSLVSVYSAVYLGADKRKHQISVSLAFVQRIHRRPVNSPQTGPVMQKMFPFDDVIMAKLQYLSALAMKLL